MGALEDRVRVREKEAKKRKKADEDQGVKMTALVEDMRKLKETGEAQGARVAKMAKLEGDMREMEVRLGRDLRDLREVVRRWKETAAVGVVSEVRDGTAPREVGKEVEGGLLVGVRWSF
jgi:hypothetical protein